MRTHRVAVGYYDDLRRRVLRDQDLPIVPRIGDRLTYSIGNDHLEGRVSSVKLVQTKGGTTIHVMTESI